jgi:hypothetical protein
MKFCKTHSTYDCTRKHSNKENDEGSSTTAHKPFPNAATTKEAANATDNEGHAMFRYSLGKDGAGPEVHSKDFEDLKDMMEKDKKRN